MATDRLKLYNGALLLVGELRLHETTGLTERREARYLLDEVWNDGGVRYCLEQGQWTFAMRTSRFDYEPSITTEFGYQRAFTKPDDWVATSGVFSEEFMNSPLLNYTDETGFWFADADEIFVRYVSDSTSYGMDLSKWPATFTEYVKAYFAGRIAPKIPRSSSKVDWLLGPAGRPQKGFVHGQLLIAKNKDAMALPTRFTQRGTWVRARRIRHGGFRDGGNQNNLIG